MNNYTPTVFLEKVRGHNFNREEDLVRYFETIAPSIFEINKSRVVRDLRTTANDGTLSNLADLIILDNFNRTQALVGFEFKLDKSINNYKGGSYEDARNQLHKYCQQLKVPYGVLISDKICEIYKYSFRGSIFNSEKIIALPSLTEIEKELKIDEKELYPKLNLWKAVLFIILSIILILMIFGERPHPPLSIENCNQIKANVSFNKDGAVDEKIYHIPGSKYYDVVKLKKSEGDRCFRTEQEAINDGFRKSKAY
jgi:hypothetical protein